MKAVKTLMAGVFAVSAMGAAPLLSSHDYLIWNRTASAPKGLYWRRDGPLEPYGWAIISGEAPAARWIAEHDHLAHGWPIIKRVRGITGDEICRENDVVTVNNNRVAIALSADSNGRALPKWQGCMTLNEHEVFLLNDHLRSLDGRYFGATNTDDVLGRARLLWRIGE